MQTAANINLFLTESSSLMRVAELERGISHGGFYRQLALTFIKRQDEKQLLQDLGIRLARMAELAYTLRRMDDLGRASLLLMSLPLSQQYKTAGLYFQGLFLGRQGKLAQARALHESVIEKRTDCYNASAILSLGGIYFDCGDYDSAYLLYNESARIAAISGSFNASIAVRSQKMIAVLKGIHGDHRGALADLEKLFPLARYVGYCQPQVFYDYLNSLAVEMCEVGRIEEAEKVIRVALASQYSTAYSEWRETYDDITRRRSRASRSFIALRRIETGAENVMRLPSSELSARTALDDLSKPPRRSARVLSFQHWKERMPKTRADDPSSQLSPDQIKQMSTADKLTRLMALISNNETSDEMIDEIVQAVERVVTKRRADS